MKEHLTRIRTFVGNVFTVSVAKEAFQIRFMESDSWIEKVESSSAEQNFPNEITWVRNEVKSGDVCFLKSYSWIERVESGQKVDPATGVNPLPTYTYTTSKQRSCVQGPLRECRSIGRALPGFPITAHHLFAFLMYLKGYLCGGMAKQKIAFMAASQVHRWTLLVDAPRNAAEQAPPLPCLYMQCGPRSASLWRSAAQGLRGEVGSVRSTMSVRQRMNGRLTLTQTSAQAHGGYSPV